MTPEEPSGNDEPQVTTRFEDSVNTPLKSASPTLRYPDGEPANLPSKESVTNRFPGEQITERFPDAVAGASRPTDRFDRSASLTTALASGDLVGDRYRVEEALLHAETGEAEIYRCLDTQGNDVVALKFYLENISPKEAILKSLLGVHHPDVVTLKDFGTWQGRFYEVMDFCIGGSLIDHAPFDELQLKAVLESIADGLQYLHSIGIVHRDIKPNNLMFRKPDRQEPVIGDFGVSSVLEAGEKVRKTSTAAFFTLDYAAPELLDGKQVGPKTDFYALGITLLHLYAGQSPFAGMDKNTILGCHFRGKVPRPANLPKEFAHLINGLLRVSPEKRWGYRQVLSWLKEDLVLSDEGLADHEEVEVGKRLPYRNMPPLTTPREMLAHLKDFDAVKDFQRGFISQWLMYFDVTLGRQAAQLEEEFARNPALGVFKLQFLLDPTRPLEIDNQKIYNVEELVERLVAGNFEHQHALESLLYSGCIAVWISALNSGTETKQLVARINAICQRVQSGPLGLFALLHTLDPQRPLTFPNGASIKTPDDIESVLPGQSKALMHYFYGGYLREWLIAAFPHRDVDIRFLDRCAKAYGKSEMEQGFFALRCHFCYTVPFPILAQKVELPKQLAKLMSTYAAFFKEGSSLLSRGWIRTWLLHTGRLKDPRTFDDVVNDKTANWPRKMEAVLHILDPDLPWPTLASDLKSVDAGGVTTESSSVVNIRIFNAGRGHLSGLATLTAAGSGFVMTAQRIDGQPETLTIEMHGKGLPIDSVQEAVVVVDTNGGRLEIPIVFRVAAPTPGALRRSLVAGMAVGGALMGSRLLLQLILPGFYKLNVMNWVSQDDASQFDYAWGSIPVAVLLIIIFLVGAYCLYAMDRVKGIALQQSRKPSITDSDDYSNGQKARR